MPFFVSLLFPQFVVVVCINLASIFPKLCEKRNRGQSPKGTVLAVGSLRRTGMQPRVILRPLLLLTILAIGAGISNVFYKEVAASEVSLSKEAFKAAFGSVLLSFESFMFGQLRTLRGIADAISVRNSMYSVETINRVGREYQSIFESWFGGVITIARVANNPTAVAQWCSNMSARYNRSVSMSTYPPYADFADPYMYLIQDPLPNTPESQSVIGIRVTSSLVLRRAIASLAQPLPVNATTPIPFFNSRVAVTGLYSFAPGLDPGAIILTGVYDSDPMSQLVATVTLFSNFFDDVKELSPHAVLVITDQFGYRLNGSGCVMEDAEQVLTREIPLTETVSWTVEIGQCAEYKGAFVTWRRNVMLAITISVTIMAEGVCLVIMLYQDKTIQQAVQRTREDEKAAAHQLIVGYICHELRNPLHIIKTSFGTLVGQIQRLRLPRKVDNSKHSLGDSGDQLSEFDCAFGDTDVVTPEELEAVIADAGSALAQMQATVNEVLDYRAMDGGLTALKLHVEFVRLSEVVMPVLLRCRAFLPNGVPLRVIMCDPEATVCIDQNRLSQVITNGMSNAGKFCSASGVVTVTIAIVTKLAHGADDPNMQRAGSGSSTKKQAPPEKILRSSTSRWQGRLSVDRNTDCRSSESLDYLVLTISNSRSKPAMDQPEDCFVPFKQKGAVGVWKPVQATDLHIFAMKEVWLTSLDRAKSVNVTQLPELKSNRSGPVKVTTGLGLPLCRGFAHASGGWLALDESLNDGMTHFWCVMPSSRMPVAPEPTLALGAASVRRLPLAKKSQKILPVLTDIDQAMSCQAQASEPRPTSAGQRLIAVLCDVPVGTNDSEASTVAETEKESTEQQCSAAADLNGCQPPVRPESCSVGPFSALHIVIVDDEPANQRVGKRLLRSLGVASGNVSTLSDGGDALAFLQSHCTRECVDSEKLFVMLLDVGIPTLSGLEVVKQCPKPLPFPIVAMTGTVDVDSVEQYRSAGFSACLGKPFDKKGLQSVFEAVLEERWVCVSS